MIGQGLNSLIPPRDPNSIRQAQDSVQSPGQQNIAPANAQASHQQAHPVAAVNTSASQGVSIQSAPQRPPASAQGYGEAKPASAQGYGEAKPSSAQGYGEARQVVEVIHADREQLRADTHGFGEAQRISGVIHVDPEQVRADAHAEIAMESINEPAEQLSAHNREDLAQDVTYRPLGQEDPEHYTKRPGSFSKRTALNDAIFHIEVEKIKSNPYQPRKHFDEDALKDLANSIREFGILQPLVVTKIETETANGTKVDYQLIAGERRLMASKRAGLERVPVIIRQSADRAEQLELAIIENLQRENLDTIETARSYARLQDEFGMTQREIAARLGKSREVIGNALRLLGLPVEIQDALSHDQINESQARLLLSIPNMTVQKQLFSDLLSKSFSVRELKAKIKNIHNPPQAHTQPTFIDQRTEDLEVRDLQNRLKDVLGTDVKIDKRGESGKIVINFYSTEELYGVVKRINPRDSS